MELARGVLVSPGGEVLVIEGELVIASCTLAGRGVGRKAIAGGSALRSIRCGGICGSRSRRAFRFEPSHHLRLV